MRTACLDHRYTFGTVFPVERLANLVADKAQKRTIKAVGRPFGVGELLIGFDVLFCFLILFLLMFVYFISFLFFEFI